MMIGINLKHTLATFIAFLILFTLGARVANGQTLVSCTDLATGEQHLIKLEQTRARIQLRANMSALKKDIIESIDSTGITFRKNGHIPFDGIFALSFKPHWRFVKFANIVCYVGLIPLTALTLSAGNPIVFFTLPFTLAIPLPVNLTIHAIKPRVTLYQPDPSIFQYRD